MKLMFMAEDADEHGVVNTLHHLDEIGDLVAYMKQETDLEMLTSVVLVNDPESPLVLSREQDFDDQGGGLPATGEADSGYYEYLLLEGPASLVTTLRNQLVRCQVAFDLDDDTGGVHSYRPHALAGARLCDLYEQTSL